jgi:hypothetical protein
MEFRNSLSPKDMAMYDDLELVRVCLEGYKDCFAKADGLYAYTRIKRRLFYSPQPTIQDQTKESP